MDQPQALAELSAGEHDQALTRFRILQPFLETITIRGGLGNLPLNLGVALNANDHAFFEQAFGAPIDELMERWGAIQEFFLPHMAEARSLLRNL